MSRSHATHATLSPGTTLDPRLDLAHCAMFTLRYEAPYLLPWLAFHATLGIDHFYLYHDDVSPEFEHPLLPKLLETLGNSSYVTVYSMQSLLRSTDFNLSQYENLQDSALMHCNHVAFQNARWMASWDIDEYFVSGPPVDAASPATTVGKLKDKLRTLPAHVSGVVLPRFTFMSLPLPTLPPTAHTFEFETYRERSLLPDHGGKMIWRPRPGNNLKSVHSLQTREHGAVVFPDNTPVHQ
eukprot:877638-Prymnesium_polylepis.1